MLIYYDRVTKLNTNAFIKRMEFRICDKRAKLILTPMDLLNFVDNFIDFHGMQIKSILKRYIPPKSILYDEAYIYQKASKLINLLWFLEKSRGNISNINNNIF
jgi:hypothetical protein